MKFHNAFFPRFEQQNAAAAAGRHQNSPSLGTEHHRIHDDCAEPVPPKFDNGMLFRYENTNSRQDNLSDYRNSMSGENHRHSDRYAEPAAPKFDNGMLFRYEKMKH